MRRATWWIDSFLLLVLASTLVWPLFRLEYLDNFPSIESTFIADARMLSENLPHPGWQPLWYCGTRFDYVYPPALRYGTALISRFGAVSPARAYHFYIGMLYVLGIAAAYWLVRAGGGARIGALLAAAGTALLSPSFLLLTSYRQDSAYWVPQRLHALMLYGEGPHISALSVLLAALALSFLALRAGRPLALAGAGVLCAFTVSNNFYGATALAIFFPIVVWSVWVSERNRSVWWRAVAIIALAYALCAFWLTPSYLKITVNNLNLVAQPGNTRSRFAALIVILVFCGWSWRWGRGRQWSFFVAGAGFFLSLYVLGFAFFGFRVAGEPFRLIPELDLALMLVFIEVLRALWRRPWLRLPAAAALVAMFYPATHYLKHAYFPFPKAGPLENRYEFVMAKWVHDHLPGERVLPSGTVRFWFDAWFDNAQPDGGSLQGMLNRVLPDAQWQIAAGGRGDIAILWLRALGAAAVVVPGKTSLEWYHDYQKPEKFSGLVPVLFDDQQGTVIYRIPRRYPGIGRTVDTAKIAACAKLQSGDDVKALSQYVDVVENPDQSATPVHWKNFDQAEVQAQVSRGQSVLIQETYDPAWRAYENGSRLPIHLEPVMNFMRIDVPEGSHTIQLRFETPLENRIGQIVSLLGLAAVMILVLWRRPWPALRSFYISGLWVPYDGGTGFSL